MKEKKISSFATVYIIGGMFYILFLFYYIGTEIHRVNLSEKIITEKQAEKELLISLRDKRFKTKQIMLTKEYQDRRKKEIKGELNNGEKEYLVILKKKEDSFLTSPESQIYWKQPIVEEWKEVFFPNS